MLFFLAAAHYTAQQWQESWERDSHQNQMLLHDLTAWVDARRNELEVQTADDEAIAALNNQYHKAKKLCKLYAGVPEPVQVALECVYNTVMEKLDISQERFSYRDAMPSLLMSVAASRDPVKNEQKLVSEMAFNLLNKLPDHEIRDVYTKLCKDIDAIQEEIAPKKKLAEHMGVLRMGMAYALPKQSLFYEGTVPSSLIHAHGMEVRGDVNKTIAH